MRQWASDQQNVSPLGRRQSKAGSKLCQRLDVNSNEPSPLKMQAKMGKLSGKGDEYKYLADGKEEEDTPPKRLSRNIPQREGIDMSVAAYNLIGAATSASAGGSLSHGSGHGRHGSFTVPSSSTWTASSSTMNSFCESHISDDSFYATSMYNDLLADKLSSRESHLTDSEDIDGKRASKAGNGSSGNSYLPSNNRRGTLGGEVLCFKGDSKSKQMQERRNSALPSSISSLEYFRPRLFSGQPGGRASVASTRALCTNPEKVLDAPEFPPNASQLLHWGSNNKLIIGLKNALYAWDADSGDAAKLVEMREGFSIRCVQWLHKCNCTALSVDGGTTAIFDCRSEDFIRSVRLPTGMEVTGLGVSGPLMAVSSDCGVVKVFDLRKKNAEVQSFNGHSGAVTTLSYCGAEPYYLATGGSDGNVRVWDARHNSPRYTLDSVTSGAVSGLLWDPTKRSRLFAGGEDGILCHLDTHAPSASMREEDPFSEVDDGMSSLGLSCTLSSRQNFILRAVKTNHPITGIVGNATNGEVLTSHRGKGQLQLRRVSNLHLVTTFNSPTCEADLSCLTLSPDNERVCAAQGDETLKFWRVFSNSKSDANAKVNARHDPLALLDEPLR